MANQSFDITGLTVNVDETVDTGAGIFIGRGDPASNAERTCLFGGAVIGTQSPNAMTLVSSGFATFTARDWFLIDGMHLENVRTGLHIGGTAAFFAQRLYVHGTRGGFAIVHNAGGTGAIVDTLLDEVYSGISLGDSETTAGFPNASSSLLLQGLLLHVASMSALAGSSGPHGPMINWDGAGPMPHLEIRDSVFFLDDASGWGDQGFPRNVTIGEGVVFVFGGGAPPADLFVPAGVRVSSDPAVDWVPRRDAWLRNHGF
jgi:hypothetical protein